MFPIPDIRLGNEQEEVKTLEAFLQQMNQDIGVYQQMKSYFNLNSDQSACRKLQLLLLGYAFDKNGTGKYKYLCPADEKNFLNMIDEQSSYLKCISTCQGLALAFHLKMKRIEAAVRQASKIGCYKIAEKLMNEQVSYPSRSWLNRFANKHGYHIYSGRTLEDIRRRSIDKDAVTSFFTEFSDTLANTDHHLIFNADESVLNSNRVYKVLGKTRSQAVREKRSLKTHITGMFAFRAAGYVLPPYIILLNLIKLPQDLKPYEDHAMFASSATGWINRNLFFGFAVFLQIICLIIDYCFHLV